ncbi:hypothetical protein U1Q18_037825 [Sarracenia purpurea var. burkii]
MDMEAGRSSLTPPKGIERENKIESGAEVGVANSKVDSGGDEAKVGSGTIVSGKKVGDNNFNHSILFSSELGASMAEEVAENEDKTREGILRDREEFFFAEDNIPVGEVEAGATEGRLVSEVSVTEDGTSGEIESGSSEGDEADDSISEAGKEFEQGKGKNPIVLKAISDVLNPITCDVVNGKKPDCLGGSKENQAKENEIPKNHAHKVFAKMPLPTIGQDTAEIKKSAAPKEQGSEIRAPVVFEARSGKGRESYRAETKGEAGEDAVKEKTPVPDEKVEAVLGNTPVPDDKKGEILIFGEDAEREDSGTDEDLEMGVVQVVSEEKEDENEVADGQCGAKVEQGDIILSSPLLQSQKGKEAVTNINVVPPGVVEPSSSSIPLIQEVDREPAIRDPSQDDQVMESPQGETQVQPATTEVDTVKRSVESLPRTPLTRSQSVRVEDLIQMEGQGTREEPFTPAEVKSPDLSP